MFGIWKQLEECQVGLCHVGTSFQVMQEILRFIRVVADIQHVLGHALLHPLYGCCLVVDVGLDEYVL